MDQEATMVIRTQTELSDKNKSLTIVDETSVPVKKHVSKEPDNISDLPITPVMLEKD